jgi:hypothetical protein
VPVFPKLIPNAVYSEPCDCDHLLCAVGPSAHTAASLVLSVTTPRCHKPLRLHGVCRILITCEWIVQDYVKNFSEVVWIINIQAELICIGLEDGRRKHVVMKVRNATLVLCRRLLIRYAPAL